MNTAICIQIIQGPGSDPGFNFKNIALGLKTAIEADGAKCLPLEQNGLITLVTEGIQPEALRRILDPRMQALAGHGLDFKVVVGDTVNLNGPIPTQWIGPGKIIHQKLTRKLLFSLPAGAYIASNVFPNLKCAFAEQLGGVRTRVEVWARIIASGAAQRICRVVWTEADFIKAKYPAVLSDQGEEGEEWKKAK